jgi:hypothetical protein
MQQYVQKSRRTTRPFKDSMDKGFSVFSQGYFTGNSGALTRGMDISLVRGEYFFTSLI